MFTSAEAASIFADNGASPSFSEDLSPFSCTESEMSLTLPSEDSRSAGYWSELGRLRSASCSGVISLLLYMTSSFSGRFALLLRPNMVAIAFTSMSRPAFFTSTPTTTYSPFSVLSAVYIRNPFSLFLSCVTANGCSIAWGICSHSDWVKSCEPSFPK